MLGGKGEKQYIKLAFSSCKKKEDLSLCSYTKAGNSLWGERERENLFFFFERKLSLVSGEIPPEVVVGDDAVECMVCEMF